MSRYKLRKETALTLFCSKRNLVRMLFCSGTIFLVCLQVGSACHRLRHFLRVCSLSCDLIDFIVRGGLKVGASEVPDFASSSASSLPGVPAWAFTQCRVTFLERQSVVRTLRQFRTVLEVHGGCLLYTSPSPRDLSTSRMPSSA